METHIKYLDKELLEQTQVSFECLAISTDDYVESEISKSIATQDHDELFACVVQAVIVGVGNKNYGKVLLKGEVKDCKELLIKNNVKVDTKLNTKFAPGDLTLRRLVRFFRYHVQAYIVKTRSISYLYRKYCVDKSAVPNLIFPGAEHLIDSPEDAIKLIACYANLDSIQHTRFVDRLKRVFLARKVLLQ
jgi:hypothetical protein